VIGVPSGVFVRPGVLYAAAVTASASLASPLPAYFRSRGACIDADGSLQQRPPPRERPVTLRSVDPLARGVHLARRSLLAAPPPRERPVTL
jgi:hypothetical protein